MTVNRDIKITESRRRSPVSRPLKLATRTGMRNLDEPDLDMRSTAAAVTAWSSDRLDVFALDTCSSMYHTSWDGNTWAAWEPLAGIFNSPPTAASWGANRLDVFGLGTDNSLYHKAWDGSSWSADWEALGGTFSSAPAVVAWGANRLDIFALGTDNSMYHKAWDGTEWMPSQTGWESLGGVFNSPPAVASWAPGRLDVVALGTDYQMYHKTYDINGWEPGWEALGGTFNSPPTVVAWGPDRLDIFALGTDDALYHKAWDGTEWAPSQLTWESQAGGFNSSPTVVSWGYDRLDLFGLGLDNQMYHKAWDGSTWGAWEGLGGTFNSAPSAVCWGPGRIDVLALGTDYAMYHKAWDGAWAPSQTAWELQGGLVCDVPVSNPPAAIPGSGLTSSSNYILANHCNNLIDLSVEINVTADLVCQSASDGDTGLSFQLNGYSPSGFTVAFPQYVLMLQGTELYGLIDWWDANLNKLLGWSQLIYSFPSSAIPAGSRLEIFLFTDGNDNIFNARFSLFDGQANILGSASADLINLPAAPPVAQTGLAPMIAFECVLVGTLNGDNSVLAQGAGTFTYTQWGGPFTALPSETPCVEVIAGTAETANTVYGVLPSMQHEGLTQSFSVVRTAPLMARRPGKIRPGVQPPARHRPAKPRVVLPKDK